MGVCMGPGTLPGQGKGCWARVGRVHGTATGGQALAVSGKGGVKCVVSSGFVSACFSRVFQLFPLSAGVRTGYTVGGKLSVGTVVSVRIALVIRVWSKTACVR